MNRGRVGRQGVGDRPRVRSTGREGVPPLAGDGVGWDRGGVRLVGAGPLREPRSAQGRDPKIGRKSGPR